MQAKDVMTAPAITVTRDTPVEQIARLLLERRISAVPVVETDGRLIGIVSEGDLMRRPESGGERRPSWWLDLLSSPDDRAHDYSKAHGRLAGDVMTQNVASVDEDTPLERIAEMLEKRRIKRVPVVRSGKVVGIVSRANLLHGLAVRPSAPPAPVAESDLRKRVLAELQKAGIDAVFVNVVVHGGVVRLWGALSSDEQVAAARTAAQTAAAGHPIEDHLTVMRGMARAAMWGE
jgi:CBS domain-containing protein